MSTKLAALSRIEEELLLIGECTANIRLSLEPTSSGSGGVAGDEQGSRDQQDQRRHAAAGGKTASHQGLRSRDSEVRRHQEEHAVAAAAL